VLGWAFAGIGVAQADAPLVANTAWIATLAAAGLAIWSALGTVQNSKARPA
jgi:hypothetical protein